MAKSLENKVAIITGGTSGIGRETAVLFAEAGAKVVVAGRREAEGKETVDLMRKAGGDGFFVKTDVAKAADVQALVQKTVDKFDASTQRSTTPASKATGCRWWIFPKKIGPHHRHQPEGRMAVPEV